MKMKVPRAIRRKIQSLQNRICQSQRDSAWTGDTTRHARRMQRRLAHARSMARRIAQL
jgi:hypothetical protein